MYYFIINRLQESKNQNEQVFHELVPSLETLEPAPGMRMSLSFCDAYIIYNRGGACKTTYVPAS